MIDKPIKGPSVTWNVNDLKEMLATFGREKTIELLEDTFRGITGTYAEQYIDQVLAEYSDVHEVTLIAGLGKVDPAH
jgi:hypothetical protein